MLYTDILCRNHLTVEHHILRTVLAVILLDKAKDALYEVQVLIVWRNLQTHKLGSLHKTVDTDGQILTGDIDIAGIEERQHTVLLQFLQILVIGQLHLMAEVNHTTEVLQIVHLMVDGILDAAVQVDGEHRLRSC